MIVMLIGVLMTVLGIIDTVASSHRSMIHIILSFVVKGVGLFLTWYGFFNFVII